MEYRRKKPNVCYQLDSEIEILKRQYSEICDPSSITKFSDLPLSERTLHGLTDWKYIRPTDIQRYSLGLALQGKDVLGAAITGSGKTLAFLIPVLECLYINKWSNKDGLGAIIISPTRELSYQIFEALKQIGKHHDFSAGLIIGGKNLKFERKRMDRCNILICTPGRLLQHMDENPLFDVSNMLMLVLDEADRCLDMGFEKTINAIIEHLNPERQTLLFSATQTQSVKDLARLSLRDPIFVNPNKDMKVPELLRQHYVVAELDSKITILCSFIKNHLKQKTIVFLSTCKQVKYIYEIFCKLRPGVSLVALYGTLHQDRRIAIYNEFIRKKNIVLFATDIASRGLDFPSVNWVIQLDCPENVDQYIHRAGRSARNNAGGESLLILLPSEEKGMIERLNERSVDVNKIHIDPRKLFSPIAKMEGYLAQSPDLKSSAKRAFLAYIKSVYTMKEKRIFNVENIDFEKYAKSLGLALTPRVRFLKNKIPKMIQQPADSDMEAPLKSLINDSDESDEEEFLTVKGSGGTTSAVIDEAVEKMDDAELEKHKRAKLITKASQVKKNLKRKITLNTKQKFDDEGNIIKDARSSMQSAMSSKLSRDDDETGGINIEISKKLMAEEDKFDKKRFNEIVKIKHRKIKEKLSNRDDVDNEESDNNNYDDDHDDGDDDEQDDDISQHYEDSDSEDNETNKDSDDEATSVESTPINVKRRQIPKLTLCDMEAIATELLQK